MNDKLSKDKILPAIKSNLDSLDSIVGDLRAFEKSTKPNEVFTFFMAKGTLDATLKETKELVSRCSEEDLKIDENTLDRYATYLLVARTYEHRRPSQ